MPALSAPAGPKPLYEIIYAVLRDHLLNNSFPPGLVLGEAVVARAFGPAAFPPPPRCSG